MPFTVKLLSLLASGALLAAPALAQSQPPLRIRGEITAVDTSSLTVRHQSGETVVLAIKPEATVGAVKNVALADIKPGSYIGTATKTQPDGALVAVEVLVFPETARGSGEGHYAWDLMPGAMMTNANVETVMSGVSGRNMKLSYKGGSKNVLVPENVPVVTPTSATRADLQVGKKVFVVAEGEAPNFRAARIVVEKDGVAPPM
ncbi:MAG: hypothetical protein M3150_05090 [Pseudomonadota bacterium]|nr:hypothetical protein [Pseudomonadota bacterium]